jgi:transcriptional regulator with AAA-type ATPase domain
MHIKQVIQDAVKRMLPPIFKLSWWATDYHRGVQELQGPDHHRAIQQQNQLHRYVEHLTRAHASSTDDGVLAVGANGSGKSNFFHGALETVAPRCR